MAQRQQHRHQRRQQQPRPCARGPWRMMMGKKRCRGRTGTPPLFLFFKKKRTKEKESRGRCSEVIQPILCRCRQEVLVFLAPSTARAVLSWASSLILCSVPPWYADVRIPCDVVHHRISGDLAWGVAGASCWLAVLISLRQIYMHLSYYNKPEEQKWIVRIVFMVPIYSICSCTHLRTTIPPAFI